MHISLVTTDNSSALTKMFRENYPQIKHYIDLWHVLRNMFKKFSPKFTVRRYSQLKDTFSRISRFIWTVGNEVKEDESEMLEKCLSTLFHAAGLHEWPQAKFVDIFYLYIGPYNFQPGLIQNVFMNKHLRCNHEIIAVKNVVDFQFFEYKLIMEDLCSDLRIEQLKRAFSHIKTSTIESHHSVALTYRSKRYHFWYLDVRNMIAAIHHNSNIDGELSGERRILRLSQRISRANRAPSTKIHKTVLTNWQHEIMDNLEIEQIEENENLIFEEKNENIALEEIIDENADFDAHWILLTKKASNI